MTRSQISETDILYDWLSNNNHKPLRFTLKHGEQWNGYLCGFFRNEDGIIWRWSILPEEIPHALSLVDCSAKKFIPHHDIQRIETNDGNLLFESR